MHKKNKFSFLLSLMFLVLGSSLFAQDVGAILWEDHFEDTATDPGMLKDVGWFYYSENDGLSGAIVEQREGKAFLQTGNFSSFVGAVVTQSNGVPFIDTTDNDATHRALIDQNNGAPNQEITFNVNFKKIESSFFAVSMRLTQRDTAETLPDTDPTHEGSYVLLISPLENKILLSRVMGDAEGGDEGGAEFDFLNPAQWTHFGQKTDFDIEQNVNYWVKFWLHEGNMKMKMWEGELGDEEADWMLEGTDPTPRVSGTFTMFSIITATPTATDQVELDDIVVRIIGDPVGVEDSELSLPSQFELSANYPNPFNPTTNIEFSLVESGFTTLKVYSVTGELVKTLTNNELQAGVHKFVFDGRSESGNELSSGMYIYELKSGANLSAKKMFLIK